MTIYTVMGSTDRTQWISKSFIDEQAATNFLLLCKSCANQASSASELRAYSPDPGLVNPHVLYKLRGGKIYYTIEPNELITDAFMELTLQPHKPKHQFKDFL